MSLISSLSLNQNFITHTKQLWRYSLGPIRIRSSLAVSLLCLPRNSIKLVNSAARVKSSVKSRIHPSSQSCTPSINLCDNIK